MVKPVDTRNNNDATAKTIIVAIGEQIPISKVA
jgi:hypothetical protein